MSSDGYFDDDLDDAAFEELDAIEARLLLPGKATIAQEKPMDPPRLGLGREDSDSFDITFDIDERELERIDGFIEDAYQGKAQPIPGPTNFPRANSKGTLQTTLFGDVLPHQASHPTGDKSRAPMQRTKSAPRNPFGQQAPKTKYWDQTAFAKSGLKRGKTKGKGKTGASFENEDGFEDENVEFEQFPAPFVSIGPPPPMKLKPDILEAKHWIYPLNNPKRDYQFNIVKHCLFENTLVALPTGLGKTFIAGVIMLNYYRWFPEGKVVFVAPTKPLVAQQTEACHKTCGIPGSDAAELTGEIPKSTRARYWKEKRVFFMTPQTLVNDLVSENCDVQDIVLLVIDEAHKGTGDFAYAQVIRFLMAKNPHFRVLALTATPGSTPDAVQDIIDALHISRIEIRNEDSLDLKEYLHKKEIKQHIIKMSEEINKVKDLLVKLMDKDLKPLNQRGLLRGANPVTLHPFRAQATSRSLQKDQKWAYAPLSKLGILARAMGYLLEGTLGMCHTYLQDVAHRPDEEELELPGKKPPAKAAKLCSDPMFQAVIAEIEAQRNRGFSVHPKMDMLKTLVVQYFAERIVDEDTEERGEDRDNTRVMVFVTFREAVDEIVEALNFEKPLIRATKFIGQGIDKQGKRGLAQKEQLDTIKKFKEGVYNVLVATSIGEEGLDIGEVDLIVCYDAQKTPIRMLQRIGRTGRKRTGYIHVLLSESREEFNFDKAKDTYKEVQKSIWRGDQLELYADVERLLPDHIKPECLEKTMEIVEYIREDSRKKATDGITSLEKGTKRKRNTDISRNMPAGTSTGFVSVAQLLVKGAKKRKISMPKKDFELAGQDDDTDREIESGRVAPPLRRAATTSATNSEPPREKKRLRKAATIDDKKIKAKKKKEPEPELTSSQLSQKGRDDEDDMEIERGIIIPKTYSPARRRSPSPLRERSDSPEHYWPSFSNVTPTSMPSVDIDLAASDCSPPLRSSPEIAVGDEDRSMAWLIDDDDDDIGIEIVNSSPLPKRHPSPATQVQTDDESIEIIADSRIPLSPLKNKQLFLKASQPNLLDDSIELLEGPQIFSLPHKQLGLLVSPSRRSTGKFPQRSNEVDESIEFMVENHDPNFPLSASVSSPRSSPAWNLSSSPPLVPSRRSHKGDMAPPALPARFAPHSQANVPATIHQVPEPSFPVRPFGKVARRRPIVFSEPESPVLEMPPPSQRRLRRRNETSPVRERTANKKNKVKRSRDPAAALPFIDTAAIHSGDEESEGSEGEADEEPESESDRLFLEELSETQVSPSYNQTMAYRQSLMSQAPLTGRVPVFANRPVRKGLFAGGAASGHRRLGLSVSSSPPRDDDEPDEYSIGSFVVDDDAEISYFGNSSNEI